MSVSLFAQDEVSFDKSIIEGNGILRFRVNIHSGSTCNGIFLERSIDSLNFELVDAEYGVCGSANFDVPYILIDSNPIFNQKVYYKFQLGDFSTEAFSYLFIQKNKEGITMYPNPSNGVVNILFPNSQRSFFDVKIINNQGLLMMSEANVREDSLKVLTEKLASGVYTVIVVSTINNIRYESKLVVL